MMTNMIIQIFENIIWGDTFEITRTTNIECK
jgi:hypothetical protein